ncbi:hypothetical protein AYI69_g3341, partial [Smittium culicis]
MNLTTADSNAQF